jgi:hypothetical protein
MAERRPRLEPRPVTPPAGLPDGAGCAHAAVRLHLEAERAWWRCRDCGTPFTPAVIRTAEPVAAGAPVDRGEDTEYLSVRELAARIPYSEQTLRHLMTQGTLQLGVHYLKPHGRIVFRWSAIQAWLTGGTAADTA